MVEYIIGSPYVDDLPATPWKLDEDGMLAIPSEPGLGLVLNEDAVARYTDGAGLL
jgi:L-alanine-DL-glutamate epimerase-like enolase superfamily enzyme